MKRLLLVLWVGVVMVLVSSPVFGGEGSYVGMRVGVFDLDDSALVWPKDKGLVSRRLGYDSGSAFGFFVGAKEGRGRLEAELIHHAGDVDDFMLEVRDESGYQGSWKMTGDVALTTLLVNGALDLFTVGPLTPWLGAGVGAARYELNEVKPEGVDGEGIDGDDLVLAFQLGAGVDMAVHETVAVVFSYRHLFMEDPEIEDFKVEVEGDAFMVGVRYLY